MRRAREEDAAFIERLFSLPHVEAFLNAPARDQVLAAMRGAATESYIIEEDGKPLGHVVLRDHDFLIDIAVIAVSETARGAGRFALEWTLRRAFEELQAHRVFLETREDNSKMRRLAERLGFVQEGLYRDGYRDARTGEFKNLCAYGMLESEYGAKPASASLERKSVIPESESISSA